MESIIKIIKDQFSLDLNGDHGIGHWERVKQIGNYLAQGTEADREVINLFAYLHDSQRENDGHDPEHGLRAAEFVRKLHREGRIQLNPRQLEQLTAACELHSHPNAINKATTIQICWDADRLDLVRFNQIPDNKRLFTENAKTREALLFAIELIKSYSQPII